MPPPLAPIVNDRVAAAEQATGFRNVALANYMRVLGNIEHPAEKTLGLYFLQCALAASCREQALAGRFLAHGGANLITGRSVVSAQRARRLNALMLTCVQYDGSGEFAFRVVLAAKSGVFGGMLAIAPGGRLDRRLVVWAYQPRQFAAWYACARKASRWR